MNQPTDQQILKLIDDFRDLVDKHKENIDPRSFFVTTISFALTLASSCSPDIKATKEVYEACWEAHIENGGANS